MFKALILTSLLLLPIPAFSEQVTTTDGRKITLNDDGTYIIAPSPSNAAETYVEPLDSLFISHKSEYDEDSIRFMPKFRNISDVAVVGLRFQAVFKNAFGDAVWTTTGDVSERVAPDQNSIANVFYVIKNNQFRGGEAYDKLLPMVSGNTGSIDIQITAIAFEDGTVESFK